MVVADVIMRTGVPCMFEDIPTAPAGAWERGIVVAAWIVIGDPPCGEGVLPAKELIIAPREVSPVSCCRAEMGGETVYKLIGVLLAGGAVNDAPLPVVRGSIDSPPWTSLVGCMGAVIESVFMLGPLTYIVVELVRSPPAVWKDMVSRGLPHPSSWIIEGPPP